ncbi:putative amidoligase enzyme-domain-containing protein [Hypomontagnella monticulosa]|nr:putative amidoligase enzyme-domain-containing protein [Hypomontagnella monticulosa]
MKRLLAKHGLRPKIRTEGFDGAILGTYTKWDVKHESAIREPCVDSEDIVRQFQWLGVEIITPVLLDHPDSFETIHYVRELIKTNFRIRVNRSCSYHVHVGNGLERFPSGLLKRIASLVWATEHLMVTLQKPERQVNIYCPSLRHCSNLAKGDLSDHPDMDARSRFLAGDTRFGEEPISWRSQHCSQRNDEAFAKTRQEGHFEPFQVGKPGSAKKVEPNKPIQVPEPAESSEPTEANPADPSDPNVTARVRTIPRIVLPRYTLQQRREMRKGVQPYGKVSLDYDDEDDRTADPGVLEGVRHLLNATSSIHISHLLFPFGLWTRAMTNFNAYRIKEIKNPFGRRTIEFRSGGGTFGPWAETWAKICVGLVRFAIDARPDEFMDVVVKCDRSTTEDGVYDVIDLLFDLGLFTEAAVAQERILEHKAEWGLEYYEPK